MVKLVGASQASTASIEGSLGPESRFALLAIEIALALWLFIGGKSGAAALVSTLVISCFTAVLIDELGKPSPRDCGCFGPLAVVRDSQAIRRSLKLGIVRNVAITAACGFVIFSRQNEPEKAGAK